MWELREDEHLNADGYPVCNNCGELRVFIHESLKSTPRCQCRCQREETDRQMALEKKKQRYEQLMTAQSYSPLRANFKDVSYETTELQGKDKTFITAYNRTKKFCENAEQIYKEGYGIYLYSISAGVGKTHLLNCMAKELNKKYLSTLIISEGDILRAFKETFKGSETERRVIDKITAVDFLFIDDIGTEAYNYGDQAKWIQQKMYDIVDRRYNSKKPTIFSSNYSIAELITRAGIMEKTVDRINGMSTVVLKIEGKSARTAKKQNLF